MGARDAVRRDLNIGKQIRDFDLVFADGHCEPLEVTIHAHGAILQTRDRLDRLTGGLRANVRRVWLIPVPRVAPSGAPYDVRRCERELPRIIESLEAASVYDFDADESAWSGPRQEEAHGLHSLEIHRATSVPASSNVEPGIYFTTIAGGVAYPAQITAAVEAEAADLGNQRKLDACRESPRRHLFVILTLSSVDHAYWALLNVLEGKSGMPPLPTLPQAVTTVWAATESGGVFVTPPEAWQTFEASSDLHA
jgi:hypothetical protein